MKTFFIAHFLKAAARKVTRHPHPKPCPKAARRRAGRCGAAAAAGHAGSEGVWCSGVVRGLGQTARSAAAALVQPRWGGRAVRRGGRQGCCEADRAWGVRSATRKWGRASPSPTGPGMRRRTTRRMRARPTSSSPRSVPAAGSNTANGLGGCGVGGMQVGHRAWNQDSPAHVQWQPGGCSGSVCVAERTVAGCSAARTGVHCTDGRVCWLLGSAYRSCSQAGAACACALGLLLRLTDTHAGRKLPDRRHALLLLSRAEEWGLACGGDRDALL